MNGIALREIHLTNKMMMMMIVMVSASILLNHDGWNATVTVCPMFSTLASSSGWKKILYHPRDSMITLLLSSLRVWFTMFSWRITPFRHRYRTPHARNLHGNVSNLRSIGDALERRCESRSPRSFHLCHLLLLHLASLFQLFVSQGARNGHQSTLFHIPFESNRLLKLSSLRSMGMKCELFQDRSPRFSPFTYIPPLILLNPREPLPSCEISRNLEIHFSR